MMTYGPLKNPIKYHSVTAPSAHILLGYDSLKCQHRDRTHRSGQKLPPPRKEYLCFQMDGKPAHAAKCSKLQAFTKVVDLVI